MCGSWLCEVLLAQEDLNLGGMRLDQSTGADGKLRFLVGWRAFKRFLVIEVQTPHGRSQSGGNDEKNDLHHNGIRARHWRRCALSCKSITIGAIQIG
jgi:hypothetical protein